jgi:hypothetical protein
MALVADAKNVGGPFGNSVEIIRAEYDFAVDAGGVGDLTILTAESECVVFLKYALVKTAVTSGGSLTFDLGKGASGNEMINDKAVAALTLDSLHVGAAPVELTAGEIVNFQIDTAAATAGKIEFVFEVYRK